MTLFSYPASESWSWEETRNALRLDNFKGDDSVKCPVSKQLFLLINLIISYFWICTILIYHKLNVLSTSESVTLLHIVTWHLWTKIAKIFLSMNKGTELFGLHSPLNLVLFSDSKLSTYSGTLYSISDNYSIFFSYADLPSFSPNILGLSFETYWKFHISYATNSVIINYVRYSTLPVSFSSVLMPFTEYSAAVVHLALGSPYSNLFTRCFHCHRNIHSGWWGDN